MKPRCKVGDIVVVIKGNNRDKFGKIVRPGSGKKHRIEGCRDWWVESGSLLSTTRGPRFSTAFPDEWLRPIRDQPGADETLTWAGLPQPSKETA